jgi:predicted O-methyltransferase YrrM
MLLAQHDPNLHVTVLDLPGVVAVARELIEEAGVSSQVETAEGDASFGDYGEDRYDAVLFSGVLHQMDAMTVRRMLDGGVRALHAGGRLIVSDIMTDATHAQPVFATLFSLQMLLSSKAGGVFAAEECSGWMEEAGLAELSVERLPPPLPYTVITGWK